jgi:hypothetical protein
LSVTLINALGVAAMIHPLLCPPAKSGGCFIKPIQKYLKYFWL